MTSIVRYMQGRPVFDDFCPGCGQQYEHKGFKDTTPLVRHKNDRGQWCKQGER